MAKKKMVKVEMSLPLVEGFEYTGEYRCPMKGDLYLLDAEVPGATNATYNTPAEYPIMRKETSWREARPSDLDNGPVVCRYSDDSRDIETNPDIGFFVGYDACRGTEYPFAVAEEEDSDEPDGYFRYCQVKDNA
jgi:hypothetical protein